MNIGLLSKIQMLELIQVVTFFSLWKSELLRFKISKEIKVDTP
jgi:hypothetical protein